MYLREYGSSGPAVVLIHGIPGSSAIWKDVADDLAIDHRVLVPDLLGFGRSPRPRDIDDLWADSQANALVEELTRRGIDKVALFGHDFGASVALAISAADRSRVDVTALGIAATNVFTNTPIPMPIKLVTLPAVGGLLSEILFSKPSLAMMLKQGSNVELSKRDYLGDSGQVRTIRTLFAHALREIETRYEFAEPALAGLDVPKTVVWGDDDLFFTQEDARRTAAAAGVDLELIEGAGHFLPSERPEELASAIRRLVARSATAA